MMNAPNDLYALCRQRGGQVYGVGAGLKAATALAQRLRRSCDVEVHPAPAGFDWNDPQARAGHD
jgi:hypothetical protein